MAQVDGSDVRNTTGAKDPESKTTYLVVAGRATNPELRDVYYCPLRDRLPAVAVPLRPSDTDAPLDLQPLVDRCYEAGRYWQVAQGALPAPPLPPDEQTWLDEHRIEAGLIDRA